MGTMQYTSLMKTEQCANELRYFMLSLKSLGVLPFASVVAELLL